MNMHVYCFFQSLKNPAHVRRVVVVLLTGQKLEAMCDPSTTGQQLFEAVITHAELPEFFFFGLSYMNGMLYDNKQLNCVFRFWQMNLPCIIPLLKEWMVHVYWNHLVDSSIILPIRISCNSLHSHWMDSYFRLDLWLYIDGKTL